MRNFMGYDRRWLDAPHIGDHVGRSIWSLGEILSTAWVPAVVGPTRRLLDEIVGTLGPETSLRTGAYAVLGLARIDQDRLQPEALQLLERCWTSSQRRTRVMRPRTGTGSRTRSRYDNARLPHALIVGGVALGRDDLTETGLEALRWLGDESGLAEGTLRLTGHLGRSRTSRLRRRRRAAARRVGLRRRRAGRVLRHRRREHASARSGRSTGSSAATSSTGRSTTSRPAGAATVSARRRRTTTKEPNRRWPCTAQRCCSTRPDCPPSHRTARARVPRRERARESSSIATRPTRS